MNNNVPNIDIYIRTSLMNNFNEQHCLVHCTKQRKKYIKEQQHNIDNNIYILKNNFEQHCTKKILKNNFEPECTKHRYIYQKKNFNEL